MLQGLDISSSQWYYYAGHFYYSLFLQTVGSPIADIA